MRILHLLATPRAEGTPNLVLDWLEVSGHEQEVFVLHRTPADLTGELRRRAAWYGEDELFSGRGWRKFLRVVRRVRGVCAERRPDLVICWFLGFAQWTALGARWARGGRVALLAHSGNPPVRDRRNDWMSRIVLLPFWLLGGRVVCCSDYVRDLHRSLRGFPGLLFSTVYNCVRTAQIQARARLAREGMDHDAPEEGGPVAIMVATLEAHKDHVTLLRATALVLARRPDFRLQLVGQGSLRAELEGLAAQLGLGESVRFLGAGRDVPELLGRADLFVFSTTNQEGFGTVLLEAMAAGLPIVATDCPACRELLAGGRFGSLVPPQDPAALARAVLARLAARNDWQPTDAAGYAASFTPERMLNEYLALAHAHAPGRR